MIGVESFLEHDLLCLKWLKTKPNPYFAIPNASNLLKLANQIEVSSLCEILSVPHKNVQFFVFSSNNNNFLFEHWGIEYRKNLRLRTLL